MPVCYINRLPLSRLLTLIYRNGFSLNTTHKHKIGLVGTGFIATGFAHLVANSTDIEISKILTRRPVDSIPDLPKEKLTNSVNDLIDHADIILECSGDAAYATEVILAATEANKKVVTVNSEFHVTTGSYFAQRGDYVTEADGDQPGCLARLKQEIEGMGFEPQAYINLKGFLNPDPTEEEMDYWSKKQQLALDQVISFTDGTKLQIEQAFVANGLDATIAKEGMIGATIEHMHDLDYLVDAAEEAGKPVSEYVLCKGSPPGVIIVAKNKEADWRPGYLPFSRMLTTKGKGYVVLRPYHLCHLEPINTIRKVINGEPILLNNSAKPRITVGAVAKKALKPGDTIKKGAGGFETRGHAVHLANHLDAVPVCLLKNTKLVRYVEPGQIIRFEDVDLADTKALGVYQDILKNISV